MGALSRYELEERCGRVEPVGLRTGDETVCFGCIDFGIRTYATWRSGDRWSFFHLSTVERGKHSGPTRLVCVVFIFGAGKYNVPHFSATGIRVRPVTSFRALPRSRPALPDKYLEKRSTSHSDYSRRHSSRSVSHLLFVPRLHLRCCTSTEQTRGLVLVVGRVYGLWSRHRQCLTVLSCM